MHVDNKGWGEVISSEGDFHKVRMFASSGASSLRIRACRLKSNNAVIDKEPLNGRWLWVSCFLLFSSHACALTYNIMLSMPL